MTTQQSPEKIQSNKPKLNSVLDDASTYEAMMDNLTYNQPPPAPKNIQNQGEIQLDLEDRILEEFNQMQKLEEAVKNGKLNLDHLKRQKNVSDIDFEMELLQGSLKHTVLPLQSQKKNGTLEPLIFDKKRKEQVPSQSQLNHSNYFSQNDDMKAMMDEIENQMDVDTQFNTASLSVLTTMPQVQVKNQLQKKQQTQQKPKNSSLNFQQSVLDDIDDDFL